MARRASIVSRSRSVLTLVARTGPSPLEQRRDREAGRLARLRRRDDEHRLARLGGEEMPTAPAERDPSGGRAPHAQATADRAPDAQAAAVRVRRPDGQRPEPDAQRDRDERRPRRPSRRRAANQKPTAPGSDRPRRRLERRARIAEVVREPQSPQRTDSPRPSAGSPPPNTSPASAAVAHVHSAIAEHSRRTPQRGRSRTGASPTGRGSRIVRSVRREAVEHRAVGVDDRRLDAREPMLHEEAARSDLPEPDAVIQVGQQLGLDRSRARGPRACAATLSWTWR